MPNLAIQIVRRHLDLFVERIATRLKASIPGYASVEAAEVRGSVEGFTRALVLTIETGDTTPLTQRMTATSEHRVSQGFALSDYLRALFLAPPVFRELVRELGPANEPSLARDIAELELILHNLTALAADIFTDAMNRKLWAKNLELNRINQELEAREQALAAEGVKINRALATANEFNSRVIASLTSGVMVMAAETRVITLYSQQMEAIVDVPVEEAIGRPGPEVFSRFQGVDHVGILHSVLTTGHFPLTKLQITTPVGRKRSVFLRAQRMFGPDGSVEGTVFVVDDVTERELLIETFSRYVSRERVTRLLARPELPGQETERRTCTVLFADIRGFTGIAEKHSPEALHRLLADYLHVMVESIVEQGGFIDKFVGDKVMALFTGPRSARRAALSAVEAAKSIHLRIDDENDRRAKRGEVPISVAIGINTGPMVVGKVGGSNRMDFTAVGEAVTVGDGLQTLAKGQQTLLGPETAEFVRWRVPLMDLGEQKLPGRDRAVRVFATEDGDATDPSR